jgi:hypothetical protein
MCYAAAMNLQKPRLGSKKTTEQSVSVTVHPKSEKCDPLSLDGSLPPSPVEIGGHGSFDSQDSMKLRKREQDEDFISTSGTHRSKNNEEPIANEESLVSDDDEAPDEVARLLTSKNHSSDSPLEKAGADGFVAQTSKTAMAPVTPQQGKSSRRRSSTASSASILGSTMTPAGVRQSARIRSSRKLS